MAEERAQDQLVSLDFDMVLEYDVVEYRKQFPYPFYWRPEQMNTHYRNRDSWIAPPHFFINALIVAAAITAFRLAFYKFVLVPVSHKVRMRPKHYGPWYEAVMQVLYYSISWGLCANYVLRQDFFYDTMFIWEGRFPFQPVDWEVYWLYVLNLGWYIHCIYAHMVLDPRKSDYWEMFAHHVITIIMLYFSLVTGYWRLGLLVLFSHDVCDIFLYTPKVLKYGTEGFIKMPEWVWLTTFAPLPIVWVIFRLGLFPIKVLYPSLFHCLQLVGFEHCYYYLLFNPLLIALLFLQIYWFYLIVRVALRSLSGNKVEDIRMSEDMRRDVKKNKKNNSAKTGNNSDNNSNSDKKDK